MMLLMDTGACEVFPHCAYNSAHGCHDYQFLLRVLVLIRRANCHVQPQPYCNPESVRSHSLAAETKSLAQSVLSCAVCTSSDDAAADEVPSQPSLDWMAQWRGKTPC